MHGKLTEIIKTEKFLLPVLILSVSIFFCNRHASLINLLMRFLSTAFLKCFLLTLNAVCKLFFWGLPAGVSRYKTRKGNTENDLPSLNNCSIALRLLSLSFLPNVYRCFCSKLYLEAPASST